MAKKKKKIEIENEDSVIDETVADAAVSEDEVSEVDLPELEEIDVSQMAEGGLNQVQDAGSDRVDARVKAAEDKVLRTMAEFENFKRRKEQEKLEFMKFANENVIVELLPVLDSFDQAVQQVPSGDATDLVNGFLFIQKQLLGVIEKLGVSRMVTDGAEFDPNLHQAVSQEVVDGTASGMVVRVMQAGYILNQKVIRPAMVVVSE